MTYEPPPSERHWLETYSCTHQIEVITFIGDFDIAAAHAGLPAVCYDCGPKETTYGTLVERVSIVPIPREEWDQL